MKIRLLVFAVSIALLGAFTNSSHVKTTFKKGEFKQWAQTPPMGWNSWDCYGPTVEEHEVKANADYMAEKLKEYGWQYIVVDIRWFVENDKAGGYNQTDPRYVIDEFGRYQPAVNRFPSAANGKGFKELAAYIHKKGLKFGIHIMRGIPKVAVENKLPIKGTNGITADKVYSTELQCEWLRDNYTIIADKPGAQEYYNSLFELYASWGVDFVKIDDLSRPYHKQEIELIRKAIDNCGRPIVLSTSPGETPVEFAGHISEHANMWRMVDDVWDTWPHINHLLDVCQKWYPFISPGTWPDCDMIPMGRISIRGERGEDRMTRLTKDEQYTLMTLWTIFRSPLMFGGDLPSNDKFTLSMLTNKEVLYILNKSTNNRLFLSEPDRKIWVADDTESNDIFVAFFYISDGRPGNDIDSLKIELDFEKLGLKGTCLVRDLWAKKDLGKFSDEMSLYVKNHGARLVRIKLNNTSKDADIMEEKTKPSESGMSVNDTTPKVTGIGGIFFFSDNPQESREWYNKNLGLEINEYGSTFEFRNANRPDEINYLEWSPFKKGSEYFAPSKKEFMINYRVQNLEGLVKKLKSNGVTLLDTIQSFDYGKFIHILDHEGNKIELWEPVDHVLTKIGGKTTK